MKKGQVAFKTLRMLEKVKLLPYSKLIALKRHVYTLIGVESNRTGVWGVGITKSDHMIVIQFLHAHAHHLTSAQWKLARTRPLLQVTGNMAWQHARQSEQCIQNILSCYIVVVHILSWCCCTPPATSASIPPLLFSYYSSMVPTGTMLTWKGHVAPPYVWKWNNNSDFSSWHLSRTSGKIQLIGARK